MKKKIEGNNYITYNQLAKIIIAFILGMFITLIVISIINNYLNGETIRFSILDLVIFISSVASLVLAVTAITLSKFSEKTILERNDKNMELQNKIFIKTIDALKKIESSTDVTKQRLEDLASGLSNYLVDKRIVRTGERTTAEATIEQYLKSKLLREEKTKETGEKLMKARGDYEKFKNQTLIEFANFENVKSIKIGEGDYAKKREGLVDGLFEKNGVRIGLCTFSSDKILSKRFLEDIADFINNLANEITKNFFNKIYFVFDKDSELTKEFSKELNKAKKSLKEEISNNMKLLYGEPKLIIEKIMKEINSNSDIESFTETHKENKEDKEGSEEINEKPQSATGIPKAESPDTGLE